MRLLLFAILLLLGLVAHAAAGYATPVMKDAAASAAYLQSPEATDWCYAADLEIDKEGVLISGSSAVELAAGRYRLHVLVARAPLADLFSNGMGVTIKAGKSSRDLNPLQFAVPYEFIDMPVECVHPGGKLRWSIAWSIPATARALHKVKNPATISEDPEAGVDTTNLHDRPQPRRDGMIAVKELKLLSYCLAVAGLHFEQLSPLALNVVTDKVVYTPGETARVTVTLTNTGDQPQTARVTADATPSLSDPLPAGAGEVTVPAGGTTTWTGAFPTAGLHWGIEVRAVASVPEMPPATGSAICAVSSNLFEVAMLAGQGPDLSLDWKNPKSAAEHVRTWREEGFTGCECFFWAPCDFGDFTPQQEDFFSGQTQYSNSISGTKNLIKSLHENGMAATVYSNLWGTDGASGFEILRKHPEWFGQGVQYASDYLEFWPQMLAHKVQTPHQWCETNLQTDNTKSLEGAMALHAQQLIDSHKIFGWDAVRYDSYYSAGWTRWATRRVRDTVGAAVPSFQFAYNSFPSSDAGANALEAMYDGGGLSMLEYIRYESYPNLNAFASEILKCRDIVWPSGGQIGPIYGAPKQKDKKDSTATPVDALYASALMLACGGHPYYNPLEHETGQFARFAQRYSEFIWDNQLRPLTNPGAVIALGDVKPLQWKRLAGTRTLNGNARRLVLHLVNAEENYGFFTNLTQKLPAPWRSLPVRLTLPAGAAVTGAWSLTPIPDVRAERLSVKTENGVVTITVPEVRIWTVLVVDFTSPQPLGTAPDYHLRAGSCMQDWYVAGPFPDENKGFETVYPPEKDVDLAATYQGVGGKPVTWQRTLRAGEPALGKGTVDFLMRFAPVPVGCAYAYTRVVSDRERDAVLLAGSDDTLQVWLNGANVWANKVFRQALLDSDRIPIHLKQGENTILAKVCSPGGGWEFIMRLADADGKPLTEGVRYGFDAK